ncbi:MAG: dihydroorotase [Rhizobacter sp.]|nr:dihydroorotase [Chlorobiales bacterium]
MSTLFTNARLINPAERLDSTGAIQLSDGGLIEAIAFEPQTLEAAMNVRVIDFTGGIIASGLFDMHCHFREPGFEYKETISSGAASAVAGGFTGVAVMPNTEPCIDHPGIVHYIQHHAASLPVDIEVIGALTAARKGEKISGYADLAASGVKALSDDGSPVMNSRVMRHAFEYAAAFGLLVIQHCEDTCLTDGGAMNEGYYSSLLGLRGIASISESIVASRDLSLVRYLAEGLPEHSPLRPRYHIAHISTRETLKLVREAKAEGLQVSCEVAPHHFALSDKDVFESGYDGNFRMNPPLRSDRDREAVLEALADGTIDCIATDHAPHAEHEKDCGFAQAAFGIVGLETAVGLTFTHLVETHLVTPARAIELLSTAPRKLLQLPEIHFKVGAPANLTFIDPKAAWTVDTSNLKSKSHNSPFHNVRLTGKPVGIASKGRLILDHARFA